VACAAENGLQSALMAPTEILAEQHFQSLSALLEPLGIHTVLVTGSQRTAQRREALAALSAGEAQLAVGTHALLSDTSTFHRLGLVVADEQHRFGVAQRAALAQKGDHPHVLVMSATPIPRTLALVVYGDLDVSVMDELPPGRQEIDTFLVGESMRRRINAFIRKQVDAGHQVYIVCPAVEESDVEDLKSAEAWADALQKTIFPDLRVALLHGKMKGAEKEKIMSTFSQGEIDILVATTVIEVGVDVPNATLMVIENAERFGLSQLHQLRGRVGRGKDKSYCVLFTNNRNVQTLERLKAFTKTNDGFKIAEEDLKLRGPGDFFGARQHGLPVFKCADLAQDTEVLVQAREAANEFLSNEDYVNQPVYQDLYERIRAMFSESSTVL
jgi:ATP-dependent DNA helicase RecG